MSTESRKLLLATVNGVCVCVVRVALEFHLNRRSQRVIIVKPDTKILPKRKCKSRTPATRTLERIVKYECNLVLVCSCKMNPTAFFGAVPSHR